MTNGYVWDDADLLVENPWVRSLGNLPRLFTPRFWNEDHLAHGDSYRPLEQVAFALGHALWRNSPIGYHALNAALYLAAVSLAYAVLTRLPTGHRAAFLAALLFAVHPVHSEAVNWLKNVAELLCFSLLSLSFLTSARAEGARGARGPSALRLSLSALFFLLALLAKEGAIVLPAMLVAYVLVLRPRPAWRNGLWATSPHWAIAAGYLVFTRLTLKPGPPDPLEESLTAFSPALPSVTLWTYEKLLLLPINLCVDRGFAVPQAALGLTLLSLGVLVVLTWLALSVRQDTRRVTLFGLCWFLLALAPYLNLIPIRVRPLAEQRLFTASLGFCLLFGLMLAHARISLGLSCAVPLALTCLTSERNFIWRDLRTMSLDTTLGAPEVARTRHNLGYGYWLQDYPAAAEREYKHALRLRRTPMTLRSLALARASRGDTEQAIGLLHESLALRPEAITHRLLGKLEHQLGRPSAALKHYEAAIRLKPDAITWLRMGHVHEDLRKLDDAAECFRKALAADPRFAPAHFALGNVHAKRGDDKAAIAFYSHATALDPAYADAHHNMGLSHLRLGDASAASRDLEQATAADPNHKAAWLHLGHLRREQSDPVRAAAAYAQAVRLDSRDAQAHYGLGLSLLATGQREAAARHLDMAQRLNPQLVAPRE